MANKSAAKISPEEAKKILASGDFEEVRAEPNPMPGSDIPEGFEEVDPNAITRPATGEDLARAVGMGAVQGTTLGLGKPIAEGIEAGARSMDPGFALGLIAPRLHTAGGPAFHAELDKVQKANREAEALYPGVNMGTEMAAGLVPGAVGALTGKAAEELVAPAADAASEAMSTTAKKRAFKALGPYKAQSAIKSLSPQQNRDRIASIGQTLLDEGILGQGLASYEELGKRVTAAKEKAGNELGDVILKLTEAENRASGQVGPGAQALAVQGQKTAKAGVDTNKIVESALDDLFEAGGLPGEDKTNGKIADLIEEFETKNKGLIPLAKAEDLKRRLGQKINFKKPWSDMTTEERVDKVLYEKLQTGVEDAAGALADLVGGPTKEEFIAAKRKFGNLREAEKVVSNRELQEGTNRAPGLTDYLSGTIGGNVGRAMATGMEAPEKLMTIGAATLGAGALNNFGRKYGNQIQARSLSLASKALGASPKLFGKYADQIKYLRDRGAIALQNGVRELMKDPGFRKQTEIAGLSKPIEIAPEDRQATEAEIKSSNDLDSVQKARMLSELRKSGRLPDAELLMGANEEPVPMPQARPNDFVQAMDQSQI